MLHLQSAVTPTKTPTKVSQNVNISPSSKTKKCIICSKYEWNPDYRRRLFRGQDKTASAKKIEKILNVTIEKHLQTEIVCKKCANTVDNIIKKIDSVQGPKLQDTHKKISDLKAQFDISQQQLLAKYSYVSTKRLQKESDTSPTKSLPKRKSLGPLFETSKSEKSDETCLLSSLSELTLLTPASSTTSQPHFPGTKEWKTVQPTACTTARSKSFSGPLQSYQLPKRVSTVATQTDAELYTLSENVWITIEYPNAGQRRYKVEEKFADVVRLIASGNEQSVCNFLFKFSEIKDSARKEYQNVIKQELKLLCSKETPSILRNHGYEDLHKFSWTNILNEWESVAPNFVKLLFTCSENPSQLHNKLKTRQSIIPTVVSAGCKLLHAYHRELSAYQHLQSISFLRGGGKKILSKRSLSTGDCMSYQTTLDKASTFGELWNIKLLEWKEKIESQTLTEIEIKKEIQYLSQKRDPGSILYLGKIKDNLADLQKYMHPGFTVVGDNVDLRTHARYTTRTYKDRDVHMFQLNAVKNRITNPALDMWKAQQDPNTVAFSDLCPSQEDILQLKENMGFLVARIWTKYIPWLAEFSNCIPKYITHEHVLESKQKTEKVNMGVMQKNEQYADQMVDILTEVNNYIPTTVVDEDGTLRPVTIPFVGDYLTVERGNGALSCKRNSRTSSARLEGMVMQMAEFHNQAEFIKAIWYHLFSKESSSSTGTLAQAKGFFGVTNIPDTDPQKAFYPCCDLLDKFTEAYIIAGALQHFGMINMKSEATINQFSLSEVSPDTSNVDIQRGKFILSESLKFVNENFILTFPNLSTYAPRSNTLKCMYCERGYKQAKSLRKHEAQAHGHPDPLYGDQVIEEAEISNDQVFNYTQKALTLLLLREEHNSALHFNDGDRIMRINRVLMLIYKECKCPKYAYGMLEMAAQQQVFLPPRLAYQVRWNRTVNYRGSVDTNFPLDLDMEHDNRLFKEEIKTYRGDFTVKSILRVSRSARPNEEILSNLDRTCHVHKPKGSHTKLDTKNDITDLALQINKKNVFQQKSKRSHKGLGEIQNLCASLSADNLTDWISKTLKTLSRKHYYTQFL